MRSSPLACTVIIICGVIALGYAVYLAEDLHEARRQSELTRDVISILATYDKSAKGE